MGSKHIKDFESKFREKGLEPLEKILDAKHKVPCVDKEGYKYCLSYRGSVSDKRIKQFDKWDKTNPFKAYNMRLYASRVQDNVEIISDDSTLRQSSTQKIIFRCPVCGKEYQKKWCHWIAQPYNNHVCPECTNKSYANGNSSYSVLTQEWLEIHDIKYLKEYKFEDCINKRQLRFDFYVKWKENIILIEVDGIQHYYLSTWTTPDRLEQTQENDKIKDDYCRENGYVLIRIPYWLYRTNTYKNILYKTFFG